MRFHSGVFFYGLHFLHVVMYPPSQDSHISEFRKMYDSEERSITVIDLGGHDTEMFASSVCDAIVKELATHAM